MKQLFIALLALPLIHGAANAQANAQAGKALWDGANTQCRNCHGANGEGAFGPDLAGRKLSVAHFTQAIRKPWGIMPAYVTSQISDAEVANFAAWFDSMPPVAAPAKWRFEVAGNAARGQAVAINIGCAQCHGPTMNGPRSNMGAVDMDFDWFKALVYNHTTAYPEHVKRLEANFTLRMRMGNFNPGRVSEGQLKDIYDWLRDEIGPRPQIQAALGKGEAAANGVTYTLNVGNGGLKDKGLAAEDVTIKLILPKDTNVVATTGAGYVGVRADEQAKANVAEWKVTRIAGKDRQSYTITLSKAGTAEDNLRGEIRWTRPVKRGASDQNAINPAPL